MAGMIYIMRKKCHMVKQFGIGCMVSVYLFCMVRTLLPIDFSFTHGLDIGGLYSSVYRFLSASHRVGRFRLSITDGILIIWVAVAAARILYFLVEYWRMSLYVSSFPAREDAQCREILQKVYAYTGKTRKVRIRNCDDFRIPVGMGVFTQTILVPDRSYTDQELYYILLHEYTHFLNGDLVVKILVQIYCSIFWWNPLSYLMQKDLDRSLEMKCDLSITDRLSREETADYLEIIVSVLKKSHESFGCSMLHNTVALGKENKNEIVERFQIILESQESPNGNVRNTLIWMAMFGIVWFASYSFVPQPYYDPSQEMIEDQPGTVEITPDNAYILYTEGEYYWIVDGVLNGNISEEAIQQMEMDGFEVKER